MSDQSVEQHTHKRGEPTQPFVRLNESFRYYCRVPFCTIKAATLWWEGYEEAAATAQERERVLVEAAQRLGTISDTIWVTSKNAHPAAREPILCPHGNAPYYPAHGTWCMYCFAEMEEAIDQVQDALRQVGALEEER